MTDQRDDDDATGPANPGPREPKSSGKGQGNRTRASAKDDETRKAIALRVERVGQMILRGMTKAAIARELGVDESTVRNDVDRWCQVNPSPDAWKVRAIEEERLTRLQRSVEAGLIVADRMVGEAGLEVIATLPNGQPDEEKRAKARAVLETAQPALSRLLARSIQLSESRRKLHGADKPVRVEHTGASGGPIRVTMDEMLGALRTGDENEAGMGLNGSGDDGEHGPTH